MWLKLSEIAKRLNVSKDVIKYHRKNLPEDSIKKVDGEVYISEEGIELIRLKLKKDTYHENFENYVRQSLRKLDQRLDMVNHLLLENIGKANYANSTIKMDNHLLSEIDAILISQEFQEWHKINRQENLCDEQLNDVISVADVKRFLGTRD